MYVISIILKKLIMLLKMDYDLVAKMHVKGCGYKVQIFDWNRLNAWILYIKYVKF